MNTMTSRWMKAALAAGLCLLLTGCGDKVEPPEAYVIGENSTVPLDQFLDEEEGGKLTAIDAPESEEEAEDGEEDKKKDDGDKDEKDDKDDKKEKKKDTDKDKEEEKEKESDKSDKDEKKEKEKDGEEDAETLSESTDGEDSADADADAYTYTYEEVPAAALDRYAAALVDEEEGFTVIDEERVPQTDLPDFECTEGSAIFAREAAEEGSLFQIAVSWTEKECIVTVSCPEGGFYEEDSGETEDGSQIMTLLEVVDYVRSLRPSDLGLEGESMSEYELVPVQGSPLVDGEVCRHLNVYQEDPVAGTNTFIGSFLVGIGKIYSLDPVEHTVEKIL